MDHSIFAHYIQIRDLLPARNCCQHSFGLPSKSHHRISFNSDVFAEHYKEVQKKRYTNNKILIIGTSLKI